MKATTEKHKVQFSPDFRIGPGTIIGRQLLQADIGLKQAEQIATDITQHITTGEGAVTALAKTRFEPIPADVTSRRDQERPRALEVRLRTTNTRKY